ncbi:MAG: hypothetical protein KF760_27665 [Candidatus Eremiobacteraeota bacterium]|nr:hypothetical protein [Candidatus Eremiobacteraeota bacterium]MCW5871052.1 hypothetical protein [Candidatus Eremiobacteraeota bacterium]
MKKLAVLWALPLLVLLWLKGQGSLTIQRLTVDPSALAGVPPWTGLLSNAGVLLWFSSATVLLFVARTRPGARRVVLLPGLLSLVLGLDDGLMLHEELLPSLAGVHYTVMQPALYILYAALLGLSLRGLRSQLRGDSCVVLLAAIFCLGGSVAVDMLLDSHLLSERNSLVLDEGLAMWLEDGLKLLGIVAWWGYWTDLSARLEQVIALDFEQGGPG